ncbi:ApaG domain-containing protein, partial [Baffinella frigidus]
DAGGNFRPSKFLFVYRITLENEGKETMQLQARAWEFLDASGNIVGSIAKGSGATGVVGKQPVLKPGQVFEYHSGVELHTSEGRMSGSFQMRTGNHNL